MTFTSLIKESEGFNNILQLCLKVMLCNFLSPRAMLAAA